MMSEENRSLDDKSRTAIIEAASSIRAQLNRDEDEGLRFRISEPLSGQYVPP